MILRDGVFLAMRAITAHRMRSGLTLLGIAVGIAAVILLTSIGEGVHRFVLAEFSQFGTNVVKVSPGKTGTGGINPGFPSSVRPLTLDDARAIARAYLAVVERHRSGDDAEQRRFARAVASDQADALAVGDDELRTIEQRMQAEREFRVPKRDERHERSITASRRLARERATAIATGGSPRSRT
mgnify:CR=1 FL=1